ncbi:MAG: Holliday junction branch migration protein RuvA [Spirochaetaceae bacterium]
MFHSLTGRVTGRRGTTILLSTGGVEWAIEVSRRSFEGILSGESGKSGESGETRVFTYLHHKEDSMVLFGFSAEEERDIFMELIKVSGIGPRQALKILSGIPAEELVRLIEAEDTAALSRIPGIGKKTAGKIILALRGNLTPPEEGETSSGFGELVNALVDMGFDRKGAQKAVVYIAGSEEITSIPENEREHEIFRRAIVALSTE